MRNSVRWSSRYNVGAGSATRPRRQNLRSESFLVALGLRRPPMKPLAASLDGSEVREVLARPKPVTSEDASTTAGPVLTPSPDPQVTSVP